MKIIQLTVVILALLVIIISISLITLFFLTKKTSLQPFFQKPTQTVYRNTHIPLTPTAASRPAIHGIILSTASAQKLYELGTNKEPALSQQDIQVKNNLINSLSENSDLLKSTDTFRAEYIATFDEIMVTITSTNILQAKNDTVNWLEGQGISFTGICNFPVIFTLDGSVRDQLPKPFVFNPLPDGC
ncbi:MAG TPA: hypothetical protein VGT05_05105 [Patescibacteria group bacterium]|nr:hypothetical protein [Patescibacteria group bacterium]